MTKNVKALKDLYTTLGGSAASVAGIRTIGGMIEAIKTVATGGGLPEVSDTDNGDVLTVVEGAWAKAAPSGGDSLVVTVVWDDTISPDGGYKANKTFAEVSAAVAAGKTVIINNTATYAVALATLSQNSAYIYWLEMTVAASGGSGHILAVSYMTMDGTGITEARYKATLSDM